MVEARGACELGRDWFTTPRAATGPACWMQGAAVPLEQGIAAAAQLLCDAQNPLVYGLTETTTEAQRLALSIADRLGGALDTATSSQHAPAILALQGVGKVTCTLGEIQNRSDLIIFWGTNVVETRPRFVSKYAEAEGMFVPRGRADRTIVVIDVARTATADQADLFLQIKPGCDFEALWTLRALAKRVQLDAKQVIAQTGVALSAWTDLMEKMQAARFGAFCYGSGLTQTRTPAASCEALFLLTREMNGVTRFVVTSVGARGNPIGADNAVAWQTGFPFAVNFNRGYPRYSPGEYTITESLRRGEIDAALVIGADPLTQLPADAAARLRKFPLVVIGSQPSATRDAAQIAFATATYGIHTPGTVYRLDGVPLRLRPALQSSLPSDVEVLTRLERQIQQISRNNGAARGAIAG